MKTFMCEKDYDAYLHERDEAWDAIRRHERTGRPLGSPHFVADVEKTTGRELAKRPPGPKPRRSRRYISCPRKVGRPRTEAVREHENVHAR
jgi:hypothetical protein